MAALMLAPMAAAAEHCTWLNAATAGGFLGGAANLTVQPGSCEFRRTAGGHELVLRIEVAPANAPHPQCGASGEALRGVGNEATACAYEGTGGWRGQQVTGRVRDQAFLVRMASNDPAPDEKALRQKVRDIAEQVAGILF